MDFCLDKTLNFLATASTNFDQSAYEATTVFSTAEQSTSNSSKNSLQTLTHSNPLFSTLREWLHSRSQYLPDDEDSNEVKPDVTTHDESEHGLLDSGLHFVEMAATKLETLAQNKDDLRHYLKVPLAENHIRLHFNQHKYTSLSTRNSSLQSLNFLNFVNAFRSFLDVVQCLSEVGKKYEDYSMLTSDNVIQSLKQRVRKLVGNVFVYVNCMISFGFLLLLGR